MKTRILLLFLVTGIISGALGQVPVDLSFNAVINSAYVQLDSVKIMNRTRGVETMLYWPDMELQLEITPGDLLLYIGYAVPSAVNVPKLNNDVQSFSVNQNYPNPMSDRSEIMMFIPREGKVHLMIADLMGRVVFETDRQLDRGYHAFSFHPGGGGFYVLTALWNGMNRSIQMISTGQQDGKACRLDYAGTKPGEPVLKGSMQVSDLIVKESGILDTPEEGEASYTFEFATGIPCPGTPTVEWGGQIYNTIQICSQCWLKENLNVGTMIPGGQDMSDNGIIEKFCYENKTDSCTKYGGLYSWEEMMQYTYEESTCGICPPGWHLPSDEEWKVMGAVVDSWIGIGDPIWDAIGSYGIDVGLSLKATTGWHANGNGTDQSGFSGLPGANRYCGGTWGISGRSGKWWTTTLSESAFPWNRALYYNGDILRRDDHTGRNIGFSVRCVKD